MVNLRCSLWIFIFTVMVLYSPPVVADKFVAFYQLGHVKPNSLNENFDMIRVRITSRCVGSYIIYKVLNLGDMWKKRVHISVYEDGIPDALIAREIVMDRHQTATFRVFSGLPYRQTSIRLHSYQFNKVIHHTATHTPKGNLQLQTIPKRRAQSIIRKALHFIK